tara:strand:- start:100 stop:321 length:222 start_codon:yes stop_codon:yes gene_type:complete
MHGTVDGYENRILFENVYILGPAVHVPVTLWLRQFLIKESVEEKDFASAAINIVLERTPSLRLQLFINLNSNL